LRAAAELYVDRLFERRVGADTNEYLSAMKYGGKIITLIDRFDEMLK
jgi:hypothetical protein